MKSCYFWATPSGPINLIKAEDMPVMKYWPEGTPMYSDYNAALKRAKESSVPIQDQERAKKMIELLLYEKRKELTFQDISSLDVMANVIYGPFTVEYEIEFQWRPYDTQKWQSTNEHYWLTVGGSGNPCAEKRKVAILYDDTPEEDIDIQFAESAKAHIRNAPAKTYRAVPEKEPQGIPKAFDYVGFMKKQYGEETQESILDELINDTFGATSAGRKSILEKFTITRKQ